MLRGTFTSAVRRFWLLSRPLDFFTANTYHACFAFFLGIGAFGTHRAIVTHFTFSLIINNIFGEAPDSFIFDADFSSFYSLPLIDAQCRGTYHLLHAASRAFLRRDTP